jgi:hypothetical protein
VGGARKRGVLKELIKGGRRHDAHRALTEISIEQLAEEFAKYLGDRRPRGAALDKLFDDWVSECKIPLV